MNPQELHINSEEINSYFRLVPNGTRRGIRRGILEACTTTPQGKSSGDWKKVGTFTEEEGFPKMDCDQDYGCKVRKLFSKNVEIRIREYSNDTGYVQDTTGEMKTRNHWYARWKTVPLSNLVVSES